MSLDLLHCNLLYWSPGMRNSCRRTNFNHWVPMLQINNTYYQIGLFVSHVFDVTSDTWPIREKMGLGNITGTLVCLFHYWFISLLIPGRFASFNCYRKYNFLLVIKLASLQIPRSHFLNFCRHIRRKIGLDTIAK
jgi:hypothetical protein